MEQRLNAELEEDDEEEYSDEEFESEDGGDENGEEVLNKAAAIRAILSAAERICQNELPAECSEDYFSAFRGLIELASERITICDFQDVRHLSYLEDTAIWPWFQRRTPSFPLPRNSEAYPAVGFLSQRDMPEFVSTGIQKLPQPLDPSIVNYVQNARDELQNVVSSLIDDRLDLVAVLQ
ncbi:MAG: hypothetical protein V4719_21655 [Planctomycetota bacterium]